MTGHARRVVFVHSSDELYGADRVLIDMVQSLPAEWREHSEVWLPTDLKHPAAPLCVELERLGVTVSHGPLPILRRAYRTPGSLMALAGRCVRLARRLRRAQPDVVYCTTSAAFLAAPVARLARVPLVVGHVQELWTRGDAAVLGRLGQSCHRLVAISVPVRNGLPAALTARTRVVVNATPDPGPVTSLEGRSGPLRYVVASRWNGWKGHRTLLSAWDRAGAPGTLTILGGPPASGESVDVPALVAELQHPDTVDVVGEVSDTQAHLLAADVVLVPSDSPEPFGLVAIEAFARGRPVVGSAAGGLADIITTGADGWLYPLGDAEALGHLLRSLRRADVMLAGARARTTYEARYTASRYSHEWRQAAGLDGPGATTHLLRKPTESSGDSAASAPPA